MNRSLSIRSIRLRLDVPGARRQAEPWPQVRLRGGDTRVGGHQLQFRGDKVRTAMHEFGRKTARYHFGKRRQVRSECIIASGIPPHQRLELANPTVSLFAALLQRCFSPGDLRQGQPQVERWPETALESGSHAL